jgi:hypothetical protein
MSKAFWFNLLFIYYWVIQLFSYTWVNEKQTILIYLLYILPVTFFVFLNIILNNIFSFFNKPNNKLVILMIVYSSFMSLFRSEFNNIASISLFYLSILVILNYKYILDLRLINFLYLITIFYGYILTAIGINQYGIFPGQGEGIYEKPVSLFPLAIVGSSFFSLYVLIYNYFLNKKIYKWPLILVCVYFIYFSYNRTSLICLLFFFISVIIFNNFTSRYKNLKLFYPYIFIAIVVIVVFSAGFFVNMDIGSTEIESIVNKEASQSDEDLVGSARPFLILNQLNLFVDNILTGTSTFRIVNQYDASGSETYFTAMIANIGILFILFLIFLHKKILESISSKMLCSFLSIPIMIIIFMFYGVLVVPYDMTSLMIFSAMNINDN